jgi:hypothetical protein
VGAPKGVGVGVDETRQNQLAPEVYVRGVRPKVLLEAAVVTDVDDFVVVDSQALSDAMALIDGVDLTVKQNEIGCRGRFLASRFSSDTSE